MDDKLINKLVEKVKSVNGDEDFILILKETIERENIGAENSKKDYFKTENRVIIFSMLSSIAAAISAIDIASWTDSWLMILKPWIDILAVVFPAVVTALVAYRGVKKSYETWIRHRKYGLKLKLLIIDYLYGGKEFPESNTDKENYKKFRNKVQKLYNDSMQEFLTNMSK